MLSLTLIAAVTPLAQQPGEWRSLDQEVTRVAATQERTPVEGLTLAFYDVRDLAEATLPPSDEKLDGARRELEKRIQRYLELQKLRSLSSGGEEQAVENAVAAMRRMEAERIHEDRVREQTEVLATLIRTFVEPALGATSSKVEVPATGNLAVTANAAQHAWVGAFLAHQRQVSSWVQVSALFVRGPRGSFARVGMDVGTVLTTPAEREALLGKLTGGGFDVLVAPKLVQRSLSRASIETSSEVAYVKDYELHFVEPGPVAIADPVIDVIKEGSTLRARVAELDAGRYGLSAEVEHASIVRPIRTEIVRLGPNAQEVEIGLPEVTRARFTADVRLADGAAAVFVTALDEDDDLALVIGLDRVEPPAIAPAGEEKR